MAQEFGTPVIPPGSEPRKTNTTLIIIVVVIFVLLCCCCLAAVLAWNFGDRILQDINITTGLQSLKLFG